MEEIFKISKELLIQIIEKAYDSGYEDGSNEFYNMEFIGLNVKDIKPIKGKKDAVNEILTAISKIKKTIEKTWDEDPIKYVSLETIRKIVYQIIVDKLGVDEAEVTDDASFRDDLGADSLDTVELIFEFESYFDIKIRNEEIENVATVSDAISILYKLINRRK